LLTYLASANHPNFTYHSTLAGHLAPAIQLSSTILSYLLSVIAVLGLLLLFYLDVLVYVARAEEVTRGEVNLSEKVVFVFSLSRQVLLSGVVFLK